MNSVLRFETKPDKPNRAPYRIPNRTSRGTTPRHYRAGAGAGTPAVNARESPAQPTESTKPAMCGSCGCVRVLIGVVVAGKVTADLPLSCVLFSWNTSCVN